MMFFSWSILSTTRNGLNMKMLRIVWGQGVRHITCMKEPLRYSHIWLIFGYITAKSPSTVIGLTTTSKTSLLELHLWLEAIIMHLRCGTQSLGLRQNTMTGTGLPWSTLIFWCILLSILVTTWPGNFQRLS